MFGYIGVNSKELTEENIHAYQSYYCGLCRCLKSNCGVKGQMLLNYDMTFLIILLTGLYEVENEEISFTCKLHPMKKRDAWVNEVSRYAADMNVLLAYHNMIDDWKDEKNRMKHTMAEWISKDYKKIADQYPRQVYAIESYMERLEQYEKAKEQNIDLVAGLTGEMLGELFIWKQDEWQDELRTLGFYMGKFIYLMDAYEDLADDIKKHNYNPLCHLKIEREKDFEIICKLMMTSMMGECARAFERLPILLHADILRNILYSGVWSRYELIQLKKKKRKKE